MLKSRIRELIFVNGVKSECVGDMPGCENMCFDLSCDTCIIGLTINECLFLDPGLAIDRYSMADISISLKKRYDSRKR